MSWNYRVVKTLYPEIPHVDEQAMYAVREVYYAEVHEDGQGAPRSVANGWTALEISAHGTNRWDLRADLHRWLEAFTRPVLIVRENQIVGEEPPILGSLEIATREDVKDVYAEGISVGLQLGKGVRPKD